MDTHKGKTTCTANDNQPEPAKFNEITQEPPVSLPFQTLTHDEADKLSFHLHKLHIQNFKRFSNIELTFVPNHVVIMGANGSGKTQILWAILFLLRGYNSQLCVQYKTDQKMSDKWEYMELHLYEVLGYPVFNGDRDPDFSHFITAEPKSK